MKLWEIRQNEDDYRNRKPSRRYDDPYEEGYRDGYRAAMKEAKEYYDYEAR